MDISFKTKKLMKVFNSKKELIKQYGKKNSDKIKRRLAVLKASPTLEQVPKVNPERCHELKGNRKGEFAVYLEHPYRLIFKPDYDTIPLKKDGGIDLNKIISIQILSVEDYHG